MAAKKQRRREDHRRALDDLQDAVDRTMEPGDAASQSADLRRASTREKAAHDALDGPRRARRR